jgi:hypothetical protein
MHSVPQNLGYSVNGLERTRTNGQLLQFRPVDSVMATLDHLLRKQDSAAAQ